MSIRAAPPNVPFAAIAHAFWGERQVALAVPLVKQFFAACAVTEIGERFAHIDHLLQIKNSAIHNFNIVLDRADTRSFKIYVF